MSDYLDDDGYPTDEALVRIRNWPPTGSHEKLLDFVGGLWSYPERWEKDEHTDDLMGKPVWRYRCSTGGWSGNESLVYALQENYIAWTMCWMCSKRGGYYEWWVRRGEP